MAKEMLKVIFILGFFILQGCVAVQTFPTAARAGDTVTLAVGSAEGMSRSNTSITYTPDAVPQTPIIIPAANIRAIIPIYPDKRTGAWASSAAAGIDFTTGHGAWLTVLVVDLPDSLPTGTGILSVQTGAKYSASAGSVNGQDIALEVLPGTGSSNRFRYIDSANGSPIDGDLSALEVKPHYLFRPNLSSNVFFPGWPLYSAVELKISGNITGGNNQQIDGSTRVILEDMDQRMYSHAQMDWSRSGDEILVNIISSTGKLSYFEVAVSIFFTLDYIDFSTLPSVTARYFDINGDEVVGPPVNVSHVTNL